MPDPSQSRVGVAESVVRWWRESAREDGVLLTTRLLFKELATFVKESTPEHKRRRYGDVEYDWDNHVDTTSATVSFRNRLLGIFHSAYQPTDPQFFDEMMSALMQYGPPAIAENQLDLSHYCFVDLGSGKGRTLLMASEYSFRRIIGAELLPDLNQVAQENIRKFKSDSQKCFTLEARCGDAVQFLFPPEPTVLYLFHPFSKAVLETVIANLERSLEETPRSVFVLYHNPLLQTVLDRSDWLTKLTGTQQYVIYGSRLSAPGS